MQPRSSNNGLSRTAVLIGIPVIMVILFIFGMMFRNDGGLGTGKEYSPPDGPAVMMKSEDAYGFINSDGAFNLVREDIGYYGRATIDKYKTDGGSVLFEVTSKPIRNGNTVTFEGKYNYSNDKISVSVNKLKRNRINTTITNLKTKQSMEDQLPSNTKRNRYIATLPDDQDDYSIDYVESSDSFIITIYTISSSTDPAKVLAADIGKDDLDDEEVDIVTTGSYDERGINPTPAQDPEGLD